MSLRPAGFIVAALLAAARLGTAQDAPKSEAPPKVAGADVPAPKRMCGEKDDQHSDAD